MLQEVSSNRSRQLNRRSSHVDDAENVAPHVNSRSPYDHRKNAMKDRNEEKKRRRNKEAERALKRKQKAKQALRKKLKCIRSAASEHILQLQAKHDTLQRKVAEATRKQDFEKAQIMTEQIRELKLRIVQTQDTLETNPEELSYLIQSSSQVAYNTPSKQFGTPSRAPQQLAAAQPDPVAEGDAQQPVADQSHHPQRRNLTPSHQHASGVEPASVPLPSTALFSPAPSTQGLSGPSQSQHQPPARKQRNIQENGVSTRRSSFGPAVPENPPTPQSQKMDQMVSNSASANNGANDTTSDPPMAVPVLGYANGTNSGPDSVPNLADQLTATEAAVLEAAAQIQRRHAQPQRRPPKVVNQKCECVIC